MCRLPLRFAAVAALLAIALVDVPAMIAQTPNSAAAHEKIIKLIRDRYSIPDSVKLTMTDLRESVYPDFYETTVTLDDGKDQRSQALFVSRNLRYLVQGVIFNIDGDSRAEVLKLISPRDQPSQGPANAPVTLVEYSDLECPVCAKLQEELEEEIVPHYGDKLRVVFKEFPLASIHDWALRGAIAAQCVHQIDSSKYVDFRTLIYKNQPTINGDNARDLLLHFGAEAGVDNVKLATCMDSRASLSLVNADLDEGQALGISQTPTSFINGKAVIGAPPAADFYKVIDESLHGAK